MTALEREAWARRLRVVGGESLRGTPVVEAGAGEAEKRAFIDGFVDEAGHRRGVDRWLLRWMLGVREDAGGEVRGDPSGGQSADVALWRVLGSGSAWAAPAWLRATGPLASDGIGDAIEVWTETELSCLHALWSIARREGNVLLRARCVDAARWMMANVQPDNGTNHPWGIQVFAWMWAEEGDEDARMYAETMLHNCMVMQGRADRFGGCILWEGARGLGDWPDSARTSGIQGNS